MDEKDVLRVARANGALGDGFNEKELSDAKFDYPEHFDASMNARQVERAEERVRQGLNQLAIDLASGRAYEADYETRERSRLLTEWHTEVEAWRANVFDHVRIVDGAIEIVDSALANPRQTWRPNQVQEADGHRVAALRALATYPLAQLEGQLTAALATRSAPLWDGWREALMEHLRDHPDARGSFWLDKLSRALADDELALQHLRRSLVARRERYQGALKRIRDVTHARFVMLEQERMVASRLYGDQIAGPPTITNRPDWKGPIEMKELPSDAPMPRFRSGAGRR